MLCSFKKLIHPKTVEEAEQGEYSIALYSVEELLPDKDGFPVTEVKVVGYYLPIIEGIQYDIVGQWKKHPSYGVQYEMESFMEIIEPDKNGIVQYLSCGLIKGIGKKTAQWIYDQFGNDTLDILDSDPQRLLQVKRISPEKLETILESYMASRAARNIVSFLMPYGITPKLANKIYKAFGPNTIELIKEDPYQLCKIHDVGFEKADKLGKSLGLDPLSAQRLQAGLLHTLKTAEKKGHLCLHKDDIIREGFNLLQTTGLTSKMLMQQANALVKQQQVVVYKNYAYRWKIAEMEQKVADVVKELLSFGDKPYFFDLDEKITEVEGKNNITLDAEQRRAIKTSLKSHINVISGGPGTGKTTIQRAILDIYKEAYPKAKIICCAPTGRAARRMEQSTGVPAKTIHKVLGLSFGDEGGYVESSELEADLVLVDEVSMLDIRIASLLLGALPYGCQIILIGDAEQLPSVGPGAVLSELIKSGAVPLTMLDHVYRQEAGSRIAVNARLIRYANTQLEYGDDFIFYNSPDLHKSAELIEQIYLNEVSQLGIDNVALLTPFRKKTETGTNALNERIRDKINPPEPVKPEIAYGNRIFRLGDKLMQTQNTDEINNGDIGYNTETVLDPDDMHIQVDFGDGRVAMYDNTMFDQLDLAYASTVHKSQGSEYTSVIINLQRCHYIMLKRPLIYTAITRAKERVIIVGEKKSLMIAINTVDAEKRNTMLATRINEALKKAIG